MNALLIMAHGSPRAEANDVVREVAALIRERNVYEPVVIGYLDVNEPTISTALEQCVGAGAEQIVAVPYFLHSGKHVLLDIPELLEQARRRHPEVSILMSDYLGRNPLIDSILVARVREAIAT